LVDVLVGESEAETVLASFGKNFDKRGGGKVLELVDVEEEVTPVVLHHIDTVHGGELDFGDKHGTKESGVIFSKFALGKVDEKDLALVHNFLDGEGVVGVVDNAPDQRRGDKLPDLVKDRGNGFGAEFVTHVGKLVGPKSLEDIILEVVDDVGAEFGVGENPDDVLESG